MRRSRRTSWLVACAALLAALLSAAPAVAAKEGKEKTIDVQLLAINDFHGNLQPPAGSSGRITTPTGPVDAGGVEYLATHLKQLEQTNPNTVMVANLDWLAIESTIEELVGDSPVLIVAAHY